MGCSGCIGVSKTVQFVLLACCKIVVLCSHTIFTIGSPAAFNRLFGTNRVPKRAVKCVVSCYVHEIFANMLNIRMSDENRTALIIASVCNKNSRSNSCIQSYPKVVKFSWRSILCII